MTYEQVFRLEKNIILVLLAVFAGLLIIIFSTPAWDCRTAPQLDMYGPGSKYTDPGRFVVYADPGEEFALVTYEEKVFSSLYKCREGTCLLKVAEGDKGKTLLLESNERGRLGVHVDPFPVGSK